MDNINIILLSALLVIICFVGGQNKIAASILLIAIFFVIVKNDNEKFSMSNIADIPEGVYNIQNMNKKKLISTAVTPILCDDFVFSNSSNLPAKKEDGWRLKKVTKGVYMFVKPTISECLYASGDKGNESIKTFALINCPFKNLCGIDTLNYKGELDNQNDYRSYFRIVTKVIKGKKQPEGKYIISNHNNKYVCINDSGIGFQDTPSNNCIFTFDAIDDTNPKEEYN